MKAKKGEASVVGVHDSGKAAHIMGGHIDRASETEAMPASGSQVPSHKRVALKGYKGHQNNSDTATSADKAVSTLGHMHGRDVIMPDGM